ncbi:hypothetical protein [Eubacterium sp. 1001713B170207_170306_E7]|uniref:hypothetical protein n=1 Tax=Eubacterium sp. 1001713B170207_170306_E7 TaxID=2787097 RepID=UPI00189AB6AD|nr:hypothetical protein [Eubacterium sp. 1001713B170207_170306_E7]
MRKVIIALLAATLLLSGTALAAEPSYKPEEVSSLRAFLETAGADGQTNGARLNPSWNPEDPATYGGVLWQDNDGDGILQVRDIQISGASLFGVLDVSGFDQLKSLSCLGTVAEERNQITEIRVAGCTDLAVLSITQTGITTLDLDGLASLKAAVINQNQLSALSAAGTDSLAALSLKGNRFVQTTLPVFNYTSEKMYAPQNVLGQQQPDKTWTIGSSGSLAGLGAENALFTVFTEDGTPHRIMDPCHADLSPYTGQKVYLQIKKDGFTPLITNAALVTDGTFDYPADFNKDGPESTPTDLTPAGTQTSSQGPATGVISQSASVWICLSLLLLLTGGIAVYTRHRDKI